MTGHIVYVKTKSNIIEAGENLLRTNLGLGYMWNDQSN